MIGASGIGLTADAIEYNKSVGVTVRQKSLKYCKIEETAIGKDGRFYVLVSYDVKSAIKMAKKMAEQQLNEYENLKSEIKGKEYIDQFDERLKKLTGSTLVHPDQD